MLSPETAEEIMEPYMRGNRNGYGMTTTKSKRIKLLRNMAEAQTRLIDRHLPRMDEITRKRALLVKSGNYHGQPV